jgi:serine/threonine protein kinase
MVNATDSTLVQGRFAGMAIDLLGLGKAHLTERLSANGETAVYRVDRPGVVVKLFDLECGKADEVSYGPFVAFNLERENFQDIDHLSELKRCVPGYYGAQIDYERKYAWISMEYLPGQTLLAWCHSHTGDPPGDWTDQLRAAVYETLAIVTRFHEHGILLIDFKPDNVIRLEDGRIRFVDLGAFFTPRHSQEKNKYAYSATPDYAELVIDTSNVLTGLPLSESSDIFAAGVALFEMATGRSRVAIADSTGDQLLALPELYRFRDSQIRDVWHAYPHLRELLPLVETQLKQRLILFAEVWYLIKGLLSLQVPGWETLPEDQRQQLILETGTNLVAEQLPWKLDWLAQGIAAATTLRSMRVKSIGDLLRLIANPIPELVWSDLVQFNGLIQHLQDNGQPVEFVKTLNTWQVRRHEPTGRWMILVPAVVGPMRDIASFTFLRCVQCEPSGHRAFQIVSDLEADPHQGGALTLAHLEEDHFAWVGVPR